ncbi:hypothetical protein Tco_1127379 [Tanacetum coccineum]
MTSSGVEASGLGETSLRCRPEEPNTGAVALVSSQFNAAQMLGQHSEPGELAPESSQAVVIPKFDMHIHTFTLTTNELKQAIRDYCIPMDLQPRLSSLELTMDNLSLSVIGIYIEQLEQVLTMDDFLKLPQWNGTVVNKGDPILDGQHPPSFAPRPLWPLGS